MQELADIQGQTFDSPRVLVSNQIGGMEDIPVSLPYLSLKPIFIHCTVLACINIFICMHAYIHTYIHTYIHAYCIFSV